MSDAGLGPELLVLIMIVITIIKQIMEFFILIILV